MDKIIDSIWDFLFISIDEKLMTVIDNDLLRKFIMLLLSLCYIAIIFVFLIFIF